MTASPVRTRFAPSPTGHLHVGGAWTAFFNWLFARHHGGAFVLRIEDTDRTRSTEESERAIMEDFRWLGITWDEGPDVGGPHGPYRQTERAALYAAHARTLVDGGHAYYCYCSPEELEEERKRAQAARRSYRYSGRCRTLSAAERARFQQEGRRPTVRLHVTDRPEPIVVADLIRGRVEFSPEHLDDYIIVRSDGTPLYNFANVVDDHLMAITHVIRAEEHLSNTPKQLLMYEAFGWPAPAVAHLPMLLGPDRTKLSKRHGATSITQYREQGFLPEAMLNFFALMGWYPEPDREIYAVDELVARFRIEEVGKSAAVFDVQKLTWLNSVYMQRLQKEDPARMVDLAVACLRRAGLLDGGGDPSTREYVARVIEVLGDRIKVGEDVVSYGDFFFVESPTYDPRAVAQHFADPAVADRLDRLRERLAAAEPFDRHAANAALRALAAEMGLNARAFIHPARVALTGKTVGPGLFELMEVLGREQVVRRLAAAVALIRGGGVAGA